MVLDAIETRREADSTFDVLKVIGVVFLEGGFFSIRVVLISLDHFFKVHVGRPFLLLKVA